MNVPATARALGGQAAMILAAALGGFVFAAVGLPVPFLSGPMVVTAVLSATGIAPMMSTALRDFALLSAGVSIGSSVTPETVAAFATYPASLLFLALGCLAIILSSGTALVLCGWPRRDAFFASAPGALATVMIIAAEEKADVPRIAIVQLVRLFLVVAVLPMILVFLDHAEAPPKSVAGPVGPAGLAVMFAVALGAAALFQRLRIAGAFILGAMVATAVLTGTGAVKGSFPQPLATAGFVLIGIFIGQRFRGLEGMMVLRTMPAALASLLASLATAWAFAGLVTLTVGIPFGETSVAFAPGGLEAMIVLAFGLGLDPVYVGVHHLARFLFVAALVPVALRSVPGLSRKDEARSD